MKSNQSDASRPEGPRYVEALERARPRLGRLATEVLHFSSIGSTNDVALARASATGLVVVADEQTSGRGRRGHAWFSPPGSGLYVSLVLAPATARVDPQRATMLTTIAAGVGVAEGIQAASGLRVDVKWPNDLFVSTRKLAGILAEASADAGVVVGYGINVRIAALPPDLRERATSLESELGRGVDPAIVLVETLAAMARRYEDLVEGRFDAILDAWRVRAPGVSGAPVSWTAGGSTIAGVTAGIDRDGALLVRVGDRIERVVGGAVTWE